MELWIPGGLWEGQVFHKDLPSLPPELPHQQPQDTWMEGDLTEAPAGAQTAVIPSPASP